MGFQRMTRNVIFSVTGHLCLIALRAPLCIAGEAVSLSALNSYGSGNEAKRSEVAPTHVSVPSSRMIHFSGHEWRVKSSDESIGPGPNYFSGSTGNVEVDDRGKLHLRITSRNGHWYCAEVVSMRSFGYGTYRFTVESSTAELDANAVLGLFTWSNDPAFHNRELDIEISRWGEENGRNGQFVVQPFEFPEHIIRFDLPSGPATHSFAWRADEVKFEGVDRSNNVIRRHTFGTNIPPAGGENARINLWLMQGRPPQSERGIEVVISSFEFVPL
jgi:hypothetical protein